MTISHSNDKAVKCFMAFVEDPTYIKKKRAFGKHFGITIAPEAVKLHNRLAAADNAEQYNSLYSQSQNGIETVQGIKDNDPKIFKVRINRGYRKFFHHVKNEQGNFLLTKDWQGQFSAITHIYVSEINLHDYKAVK